MTNQSKSRTITVEPDSELARALDEAAAIVLERNGVRYRLSREDDDPWANYDPAKLRASLRQVAGTITPEEGERLKEALYRGREEGTRPLDRP